MLFAIVSLIYLISAKEENEEQAIQPKQKFSIRFPAELSNVEGMKNIAFNIANFGYVPYGQRIVGTINLADPIGLCDENQTSQNSTQTSQEAEDVQDARIIIAERGNCTFYQKSINAQHLGYHMLIIANNNDEDVTNLNLIGLNNSEEIDIPAIMINKKQGDIIIKYMKDNQNQRVRAFIRFPDNFKSNIVDYQYWFSPMDKFSYQFLEQFYPFQVEMENQLKFTPHYAIIQCHYCKSQDFKQKDINCLSGGRYCAPDPDGDGPLSGADAVKQIVKQLCIKEIDILKWWRFVVLYSHDCLDLKKDHEKCVSNIFTRLNLNETAIQECYTQSFNGQDENLADNDKLSKELQLNQQSGIMTWPVLTINGLKYKGSLTVQTYKVNTNTGVQELLDTSHFGPLQTICRSFTEESIPKICQKRMIGFIDDEGNLIEHEDSSEIWIIWIIVIALMILIMLFTMWQFRRCYKIQTNEKVNEQMNIRLAQYYALSEQEKSMRK